MLRLTDIISALRRANLKSPETSGVTGEMNATISARPTMVNIEGLSDNAGAFSVSGEGYAFGFDHFHQAYDKKGVMIAPVYIADSQVFTSWTPEQLEGARKVLDAGIDEAMAADTEGQQT